MSSLNMNYVLKNTKILEEYRDKCYVNNVLCQRSSEYYGRLKMLISIPLIVCSCIMTVMNSTELNSSNLNTNFMRIVKILNIILNSLTVLLISFNNTFKISEKHNQFRILSIKYIKLCHVLEDNLVYSINNISHQNIFELVVEYDNLNESLEYSFPDHIKRAVKKLYVNKKTLPNILNCETDFVYNPDCSNADNMHKTEVNGNDSPLIKHFKKNHDFQLGVSKKSFNDCDIKRALSNNTVSHESPWNSSSWCNDKVDKHGTEIELTNLYADTLESNDMNYTNNEKNSKEMKNEKSIAYV